jgi:hypothetical protein
MALKKIVAKDLQNQWRIEGAQASPRRHYITETAELIIQHLQERAEIVIQTVLPT